MDDYKFSHSYYYKLEEPNLMDFALKSLSDLRYKIEDSIMKKISYELNYLIRKSEFENNPTRISTDLFGYEKYQTIYDLDERIKKFLNSLIDDKTICKYQYKRYDKSSYIMISLSLDGTKYFEISTYLYNEYCR